MLDAGTSNNQLSTTQQFANNQNFSFNLGKDSESGSIEYGGQTASQEQTRKEDFGLSASVGVGINGDGTGGTASLNKANTEEELSPLASFTKNITSNTVYIALAVIATLGTVLFFVFRKKKKKR